MERHLTASVDIFVALLATHQAVKPADPRPDDETRRIRAFLEGTSLPLRSTPAS